MRNIAHLSVQDRSDLFRNTADRMGLSDAIVEKDFWVCFTLDYLFTALPGKGYGVQLISALKKLARLNYADPAPSPLLVKLEYSHPTLSQRIEAIEKEPNDSICQRT